MELSDVLWYRMFKELSLLHVNKGIAYVQSCFQGMQSVCDFFKEKGVLMFVGQDQCVNSHGLKSNIILLYAHSSVQTLLMLDIIVTLRSLGL